MRVGMDIEQRYDLITRNTLEVVDEESLRKLLAEKERPRLYIGFEPSGLCHFGWMLVANKIRDYIEAGLEVIIFFADWHAQINGKLGGSLETIQLCAEYMKDSFESLGIPRDKVTFVMASEILDNDYWATVIRIGSETSIARVKRAMTIMGRKADNDEVKTSMMLYPLMQPADIFKMDIDIGYGGLDQRRAHMLARDVAKKCGWKAPVAIHTPLVPGLKAMNRMDPAASKMSKSKPDSGILIHDRPEDIEKKLHGAFCPMPGEYDNSVIKVDKTEEGGEATTGNPVLEIARLLLFSGGSKLKIERPEKYGGSFEVASYEELEKAYQNGLHPNDLKHAVAKGIADSLAGSREYFERNPDNYRKFCEAIGREI